MDKVKCADCGLLAAKVRPDPRLGRLSTVVEAPINMREEGNLHGAVEGGLQPRPFCYTLAARLDKEMGDESNEERLAVLTKDRECSSFLGWMPGFTPKEHVELDRECRREKEERRWREERTREDRKWREDDQQQAKEWREEDQRQYLLNLVITGGLITLVSTIVQLIAADKLPWFW